ncbi:MAG: energy transducer TonB, partial [Aliivibrio sp.]|nr:energy transducer TonB [Aliivibrio sp.]
MLRSLFAFMLAIVLTLALFSFMAWMTIQSKNTIAESESLQLNVVMAEPESQSQRRIRQLPEPPKTPNVSELQSSLSSQVAKVNAPEETSMPSIELGEIGL